MKTLHIYILSAALAAAPALKAQDLVKEIDVDRTIVPQEREATRPGSMSPRIFTPKVEPVVLSIAEYSEPSALTPFVSQLPAARWGETVEHTPYRGYAALGYFPLFNLGVTAGYRLIDNEKTSAGAWLMYNGDRYKSDGLTYGNHVLTIGANGRHSYSTSGSVNADLHYAHSSVGLPFSTEGNQGVNDFALNLGWCQRVGIVGLHAKGALDYIGFSKLPWPATTRFADPAKQTSASLELGAIASIPNVDFIRLALDADAALLASNNYSTARTSTSHTLGMFHILPAVDLVYREFSARLGVNLSIATGVDKGTFNAAPNVVLGYAPRQPYSISITLGGGMEHTRAADIFARDIYFTPEGAMQNTRLPFTGRVDLGFGPFSGFRANIHAGYASASSFYMPWVEATEAGATLATARYEATKLRGFSFGIGASYAFRRLLTVHADMEAATSSDTDPTHGWYLWADRANWVANVGADVTPMAHLTLNIGLELRTGRHSFSHTMTTTSKHPLSVKTGSVTNLNVGAKYEFSPRLTFFVRGENLLNHHYLQPSLIPAQGIKGLLGAEYKF